MILVSEPSLAAEAGADGAAPGSLCSLHDAGSEAVTITAPWDALRQAYVQYLVGYGEFVGQHSQQAMVWQFFVDSEWVGSYVYWTEELTGQGHWAQLGETPTFVPDDPPPVVLERYEKDAYGVVTVLDAEGTAQGEAGSGHGWQYLHQGGRFDFDSGLYHFRNGDYDPKLGRWLNPDPAGYVDGACAPRHPHLFSDDRVSEDRRA